MLVGSFPKAIRALVREFRRTGACSDLWSYDLFDKRQLPLSMLVEPYKVLVGSRISAIAERIRCAEMALSFVRIGERSGLHLLKLYRELLDEPLLEVARIRADNLPGYSCFLNLFAPDDALLQELYEAATEYDEVLERLQFSFVPVDRWKPVILTALYQRNKLPVVGVAAGLGELHPNEGFIITRNDVRWRIDWSRSLTPEEEVRALDLFEDYYREVTEKIVVMHVSSNPLLEEGEDVLKVDAEVRDLKLLFRRFQGVAKLSVLVAATPTLFRQELARINPTIVHFSGHADASEGIQLEDDQYLPIYVGALELRELLRSVPSRLKLLVLTCCNASELAAALSLNVPIVAGIGTVGDEEAREFSKMLYKWLLSGHDIDSSFAEALHSMSSDSFSTEPRFCLLKAGAF